MASLENDLPLLSYASKLQGQRVLVIGGTSGIGFGVACAAYEAGAQVFVSSSSTDKVARTIQRIREGYPAAPATASIDGRAADLADPVTAEDNLKALLEAAVAGGTLDHIAFTAGGRFEIKPLTETSVNHIQTIGFLQFVVPILLAKLILQRNQSAAGDGSQGTLPYLRWSPESSITYTSGSANMKIPAPGWSSLAGYSAGVEGMMRGLSQELMPVRINTVSPGVVETELFANIPESMREGILGPMRKATTTGRLGRPQDLAETYLYCMRDGFVAGSVLSSNGGRLVM